jgi:hypothetical protein
MSRVDDLIDLIQTANDFYLINPNRNVRMAYIQIDDLCELAMKSWLQMHVPNWSHISHQRGGRDYYKSFKTIINEIKNQNPGDQSLSDLLDRFNGRRDNRNRFFHDQDLSGLTVTEYECLRAFCDLYDLTDKLFGAEYRACLVANQSARTQTAVIRLRHKGYFARHVYEHYQTVVRSTDSITLYYNSLGHEYRVIYDDPQGLYDRMCRYFDGLISENQAEIDRIHRLQRRNRNHEQQLEKLEDENNKLRAVVATCLA